MNMKKLLCSIAILTIAISVSAQIIIPKVGVTISTVKRDFKENYTQSTSTGVSFGFAYQIDLGKLSLQPELIFIQKGYKAKSIEYSPYIWTRTYDYRFNYLELPVFLKTSIEVRGINFQPYIGPSISCGLSINSKFGNIETDSTGNVVSRNESEPDFKFGEAPFSQRVDYGIQLGAAIVVKKIVDIDLRYGFSLNDHYDNVESKHRVFQFIVGVPIHL
jgi:hypothetical protein